MSHKPMKASSSFVSDPSKTNLGQVSPRIDVFYLEQRSPFTMANNHSSKTNFIGDSILLPEGSRAVAVTETGEKHLIQLDDNDARLTNTYPLSSATLPKIVEQSSSHLLLSETGESVANQLGNSESSIKLIKKSKNSRCNIQKRSLKFTPRSSGKSSLTSLLSEQNFVNSKPSSVQTKRNTSSETQTDYSLPMPSSACGFGNYNLTTQSSDKRLAYLSMSKFKKNSGESMLHDPIEEHPQKWMHRKYQSLPEQTTSPLRIYKKPNRNLSKFSEFRALASVLTLITVIWWLFSTFFGLQSLSELLDPFMIQVQNWYSAKEKPKTKAELFLKFLQDLWT